MNEICGHDDSCCFLNIEAAGELPQEIAEQLRAFQTRLTGSLGEPARDNEVDSTEIDPLI